MAECEERLDGETLVVAVSHEDALSVHNLFVLTWPRVVGWVVLEADWECCLYELDRHTG